MAAKSKLHISGVYKSSYFLIIENIVPLFLLAVVLFIGLLLLLDFIDGIPELAVYKNTVEILQKTIPVEYKSILTEAFKYVPSFSYVVYFSFLLPVAVIKLLFNSTTPRGSFLEKAFTLWDLIKSYSQIWCIAS